MFKSCAPSPSCLADHLIWRYDQATLACREWDRGRYDITVGHHLLHGLISNWKTSNLMPSPEARERGNRSVSRCWSEALTDGRERKAGRAKAAASTPAPRRRGIGGVICGRFLHVAVPVGAGALAPCPRGPTVGTLRFATPARNPLYSPGRAGAAASSDSPGIRR